MMLSISNIAWDSNADNKVYELLKETEYKGLEIAPTRIFQKYPYDNLDAAAAWSKAVHLRYGFVIPSIQSIWYGRSEKIFGSDDERKFLISYTKKAVDFAEAIGCRNLVFGCPRNRSMPDDGNMDAAIRFFKTIGDYAFEHHTVVAMEANPPIYNTNFINTTEDAIDLIERVESRGFQLNLDVGAMIENREDVDILIGKTHLISHVHISEPGLKPIEKRSLHRELAELLNDVGYERFVSIEVGKQENIESLKEMIEYVRNVFK